MIPPHNSRRRGVSFFEQIMMLVIIAMFLTTFYAVISILNPNRQSSIQGAPLLARYQTLLERMNQDIRFAQSAQTGEDNRSLTLRRGDGVTLVYRLEQGNLYRETGGGRREVLLEAIASGQFRLHPEYPDLVTVVIIPSDQMGVPFFTSFAVRRESQIHATGGKQ
ncbi:MAG: hypothetical protein HQM09_00275 [Candidatus Riflebacteria bacterium]|nr:hypothetical protein [Candidatus Riflebacteria bacterium]